MTGESQPVEADDPSTEVNAIQPPNPFEAGSTIGLCLSGGGYRATAFALGTVTALVDAGVWQNIRWISSVSGGSYANALIGLALRDETGEPDPKLFERTLARGIRGLTRPGSLLGSPLRGRGHRTKGLVARMYGAGIQRTWTTGGPSVRTSRLSGLQSDTRCHMFMAVDIATSAPVAISDRLVFAPGLRDELQFAYEPGKLPLAAAVRASASFPGLPAVRVRGSRDLGSAVERSKHDLLLVDGGVWNNLATNWEIPAKWLAGALVLPPGVPPHVDYQIVVDASAPPRRPRVQRWFEWSAVPLVRSFEAAVQSSSDAQRRLTRRKAGTAFVAFDRWPTMVQRMDVFADIAEGFDWTEVEASNSRVGTVWKGFRGLRRTDLGPLLAHSYATTAAYLTDWGVPYDRFRPARHRFPL